MTTFIKKSRSVIATVLAGTALMGAGMAAAHAETLVVSAPAYATYGQPEMTPVGVSINIGWHGDRYWDGHRYWAHDDWVRHHPHDERSYHHDDHDHHG